jgi:hypothetical protein
MTCSLKMPSRQRRWPAKNLSTDRREKIMFKRKPETQQLSLNQFNAELAALVDRAIGSRIHLIDIRNSLDNKIQAVEFQYAQRPV